MHIRNELTYHLHLSSPPHVAFLRFRPSTSDTRNQWNRSRSRRINRFDLFFSLTCFFSTFVSWNSFLNSIGAWRKLTYLLTKAHCIVLSQAEQEVHHSTCDISAAIVGSSCLLRTRERGKNGVRTLRWRSWFTITPKLLFWLSNEILVYRAALFEQSRAPFDHETDASTWEVRMQCNLKTTCHSRTSMVCLAKLPVRCNQRYRISFSPSPFSEISLAKPNHRVSGFQHWKWKCFQVSSLCIMFRRWQWYETAICIKSIKTTRSLRGAVGIEWTFVNLHISHTPSRGTYLSYPSNSMKWSIYRMIFGCFSVLSNCASSIANFNEFFAADRHASTRHLLPSYLSPTSPHQIPLVQAF